MANFIANNLLLLLLTAGIDLENDTLKFILCGGLFDGNDEDDFVGDITILDEIVATNYVGGFGGAGRQTLKNVVAAVDDPNNEAYLDCDDETWTALGGAANDTIEWIGVIKEITSDALSPIVGYVDKTTATLTTNGSDVTVQIPATGWFALGRKAGS